MSVLVILAHQAKLNKMINIALVFITILNQFVFLHLIFILV